MIRRGAAMESILISLECIFSIFYGGTDGLKAREVRTIHVAVAAVTDGITAVVVGGAGAGNR